MSVQILGLTAPVMGLVFAALFAVLWWRGGLGRHVLAFALGYVMFAAGFLITHFLPSETYAAFFATHACYSAASVLLIWGVSHRLGRPAQLGIHLTIYLVAVGTLLATVSLSDDAGPRMIMSNMGYGAMFLVSFANLLGAPRRNFVDLAVLGILALHTVDFMVRPMISCLIEGSIPIASYRESTYYAVISIVLMVKTLVTALVLIAAAGHDLFENFRRKADLDDLTGIRSRRAFEADVSHALQRASQRNEPVCLIVADIDHFKQVNDLWGHQAGDEAIVEFAALLQRMIRDQDLCGRIGGEEFCVLVRNCDGAAGLGLAERVRCAFAQTTHSQIGDNISLTASFGVAKMQEGEGYEGLFGRADAALYRAKQNGRNRVESDEQERRNVVSDRRIAAA